MNDINHKEVDLIVSISDLKKLQKTKVFKLWISSFVDQSKTVNQEYYINKKELFEKMPF
jgi:hypothetical protein